jgi:lipopolysaccharide transport system permease protein
MILRFPQAIWKHRQLIWGLSQREIQGRYRGSILGIGWSFLHPLGMLAVYTFVFSQVFKARWGGIEQAGPLAFAVNLFAGLIVFNLFAECASRGPTLITANPNYVKKVVFPLEILAPVSLGTSTFHALSSLAVLLIFELASFGRIPLTIIWLPVVWMPILLICLAMLWVLSAVGVFLRDIDQIIGVFVNMMMFLSPIFFPLSALPLRWLPLLQLNPLAQAIEQTRAVLLFGQQPGANFLIIGMGLGLAACELAYRGFQRARPAFADVI